MMRTRWSPRAAPGTAVLHRQLVLRRAPGTRQGDHEGGAHARVLRELQRAAFLGHQPLGHVEADALAGGLAAAPAPVEDRGPLVLGDAAAVVGDADVDALVVAADDLHQAVVGAAVLHGVVHQDAD